MPDAFDPAQLGLEEDSEILRLLAEFPEIEPRRYRDGEFLVRQEDDSQEVFLVLKGAFAVERTSDRPGAAPALLAAILCDPDKPAIVGEMAYLGAQRRSASVRSSGGSLVLCLSPAHVDAIIAGFPGLTRAICAQFSRRLKETNGTLCELQARFATGAQPRVAAPGEVLFRQGETARTLFQVMTGRIRLEGEGGVELLGPDQLPDGFLELESYLRGRPHGTTATVEETAFLVAIDAGHREAVLRGYPGLVLGILEG